MTKYMVLIALLLSSFWQIARGQNSLALADSIRQAYKIPELGYAVVSSKAVLTLEVLGLKKIGTTRLAERNDLFRIGSNTKAITGFLAAQLVQQKKIKWDSKFFDFFPELKANSHRAYWHLTLLDLLSFRARLFPYTYTYSEPTKDQFEGTEAEQRYQFAGWFFQQAPVPKKKIIFSNLGYIAAALMLEKASGQSYKALVAGLGKELDIHFGFGPPNVLDSLQQPWGHDKALVPEPPADNYKLEWLLAAGNIHASLPDYARFIQLQLQGLLGKSDLLPQKTFHFMHYGLKTFALGWFWAKDENGQIYSYNVGNPGTFLTKVYVFKDLDRAFILFSNAQTSEADQGLDLLYNALKRQYIE